MGRNSDSSSDSGLFTIVFVLGPPGCGKGTLCQRVVGSPNLPAAHYTHLSLGDHLRALGKLDAKDQKGANVDYDMIREHIQENKLLPADVLTPVLEHKLGEQFSTTWLIDGFPRNMETAVAFEKTVSIDLLVDYEQAIKQPKSRKKMGETKEMQKGKVLTAGIATAR